MNIDGPQLARMMVADLRTFEVGMGHE